MEIMNNSKSSQQQNHGRRQFLQLSGTAWVAALGSAQVLAADKAARVTSKTEPLKQLDGIKALFFDVQGTLVDFYSTIVEEGGKFSQARGFQADWGLVTEQWRAEYRVLLDKVIKKERPWTTTDVIFREALDIVLAKHSWGNSLSAADRDELTGLWSRLVPWSDSAPGLERLKKRFITSTLSNGSMASVLRITKYGNLPLDAVLTAELIKSSKPDPLVYQMALDSVGLQPHQAMMVACHKYDLSAAKKHGMKVAFIARPLEFGPNHPADTKPEPYFDYYANSITELASMLGA